MSIFARIFQAKSLLTIPLAIFFMVMLFCTLRVFKYAQLLRPSADDYCFGKVGQFGIVGGVYQWWDSWTGNIFSTFIQNALIGVPLAFFPWRFVSSISFVIVSFIIGLSIFFIGVKKIDKPILIFVSMSAPFLWWVYLWSPQSLGAIYNLEIANALLHWQTVNAGSVLCTLLAVLFVCSTQRLTSSKVSFDWLITASFGVFMGLCGEPINLVVTIILTSLYIYSLLAERKNRSLLLVFIIFILIGQFISHQAPGYLIRYNLIKPDLSFSEHRIFELLTFTLPQGFLNFINLYFNFGSLTILLITTSISWISLKRINSPLNSSPTEVIFLCLWFSFVFSMTARFLEAFSYVAFWHQIPSLVCAFLALIFIGISFGQYLSQVTLGKFSILLFGIFSVTTLLGVVSTTYLIDSVKNRHVKWYQGAAPIGGIADVENKDGWVMVCWRGVAEFRRDAPIRGQ